MAPLEPWKRVYIEDNFLYEDNHGNIECNWCHEGNAESDNKLDAHQGLIAFPSEKSEYTCRGCHIEEHANNSTSLHTTQEGYFERFRIRAGYDMRDDSHLLQEFNDECGVCHTSCGQCHVSRPITSGSGLNWGHEFRRTPDLTTNCTACHGSRIGEEYTGAHEIYPPDVHYVPNAKRCEFCHKASEIHGNENDDRTYRYDENKTTGISCEQCHYKKDGILVEEINDYHKQHWQGDSGIKLTCQVCHSQPYKNCNGCHVGGGGITGSSYLTFEIGKNYLKDNDRYKDYDYITVRHIPITPDTFEPWGVDDLSNFEASEPTWKLTTPHNIQRWTPQTTVEEGQSCGLSCHDTSYYLTDSDIELYEDANYNETTGDSGYGYDDISRERKANKDVIIK